MQDRGLARTEDFLVIKVINKRRGGSFAQVGECLRRVRLCMLFPFFISWVLV